MAKLKSGGTSFANFPENQLAVQAVLSQEVSGLRLALKISAVHDRLPTLYALRVRR